MCVKGCYCGFINVSRQQNSLFVLLIRVGSFPQQQLGHLFPLWVRRRDSAMLTHTNGNAALASVQPSGSVRVFVWGSHQRSLVCVRVFEVDDLQDQTLLGFGCIGLASSLKERVTLKLIWGKKELMSEAPPRHFLTLMI